jgi:hypothetical protein
MDLRYGALTLALLATIACGGAAPQPATPPPSTSAAPSASATAPEPPPSVSVVRFDDLGVSLAVPAGFHVVGDEELAARIRSSASPRLTASLESRAPEKKGLPLLTLTKEFAPSDALTLTLTATVLPADATVAELLTQQQAVMNANLEGFAVTDGPRPHDVDGVQGLELSDHYALRSGAEVHKVASTMRLFVRKGLAFAIVAVWNDGASHADEARALLDGLHFYDAQP